MVFIPDEILSELLQSYPESWGLEQGVDRINWRVLGRGLADKLSERTGRLITVEDVRIKCKRVRNSLRRLDTSKGKVYANLFTYAWYAHKLGLTNAVDKIASELLSRGELRVVVGDVPVGADLGKVSILEVGENVEEVTVEENVREVPIEANVEVPVEENVREVPVEANVEVPVEENVEDLEDFPGTSAEARLEVRQTEKRRAGDLDDAGNGGPTTSAEAAQRLKARRLQPFDADEAADRVVPNIQRLREVVSKLSAHDKVVNLHFDEVFTDQTTVHCRSEDKLNGCDYVLGRKVLTTKEHPTVLVCGVRSLLTPFNMVLSAYPMTNMTNSIGCGHLIEENIKYTVAIGLEVKALVSDRSPQNRRVARERAGYEIERADGTNSVSYAENSEKKGLINSDKAIRTYELFAAITNFASIFHSGKISTVNWQAQQAVLEGIVEFLTSADLQTDTLGTDTVETFNAFKKLMGELLEAYPDITIQGYRLSTDLLERRNLLPGAVYLTPLFCISVRNSNLKTLVSLSMVKIEYRSPSEIDLDIYK
uniref:Transposable element P transposase-like RNase H domain-containing protein n=1 Tax=Glossina austeni TaxID=7395 RepID=A0A1A9UMD3_GLOAU